MGEGDAAASPRLARDVVWNFVANVADGALFALALSLASQQTVLPVLVRKAGGGNIAVGLIPVIWIFGFNVPQLLVAAYTQRSRQRKQLLLKTALLQRIPWLLLGLAILLVFESSPAGVSLVIFFVLFGCAAVAGSINFPVWFDLVTTLTPLKVRGRLFGLRSIFGSLLGIAGGALVTWILTTMAYPTSFGVLFLAAFGSMMLSYLFLVSLRAPQREGQGVGVGTTTLRHLWPLLREHVNFRRFLVADALLVSSQMGTAFLAVYAFARFDIDDGYVGIFTIATTGSTLFAGLVLGMLADRYGHRVNMMLAAGSAFAGCVAAMVAPTVDVFILAFIGLSLTLSIGMISRLPFIAELAPEETRPSFIALTNLVTGPFILWGLVGGWLADHVSYEAVFLLAAGFALSAFVWILTMVRDPRQWNEREERV